MSFWAGLSAAFTVMQGYNQMQQGKAIENYYTASAAFAEFEGKNKVLDIKKDVVDALTDLKEKLATIRARGAAGGLNIFEGTIFNNLVELRESVGEDLRLETLREIITTEVYKNKADTLRAAGAYAASQGKFGFYMSLGSAALGFQQAGGFDLFGGGKGTSLAQSGGGMGTSFSGTNNPFGSGFSTQRGPGAFSGQTPSGGY